MRTNLSHLGPCRETGSAVAVVITMIGIMMICVSVNIASLLRVNRELNALEKKQIQRVQNHTNMKLEPKEPRHE